MILQCGYLNKSVFYYHCVQNVIISKDGWTNISVKYDNTVIKEYVNSKDISEYKFELTQDNQYNILLKCNNDELMSERQLFKVDLIIDGVDDKIFSHRFEEGLIVDH